MSKVLNYKLFCENVKYKPTAFVTEICVCMILLNNEFLDDILDRGLKSRYTHDSHVFIQDLKTLLLKRNRLFLGKYVNGKCVEDDNPSKINSVFNSLSFNMDDDWYDLVNARIVARSINDKLLPEDKLTPDIIEKVFWIGPNKTKEHGEDIVIEMNGGKQYSCYLNKSFSSSKTTSFIQFIEDIIGDDVSNLYSGEYLDKWNELTKIWTKLIYENAKKPIQSIIEKFITVSDLDDMTYEKYHDIKHNNEKYKHLGEYISFFSDNFLEFDKLMSVIWKERERCFDDVEKVEKEWNDNKNTILNSKILERLLTVSLTKNIDDIEKLPNNYKKALGKIKMKLIKTIVEKMGCQETPVFYLSKNGADFIQVPERSFFREKYEDLDVEFDYHVKMDNPEGNFVIKMVIYFKDKKLLKCNVEVKFSGGEMSGKLSAKFNFIPDAKFNYIVSINENINYKRVLSIMRDRHGWGLGVIEMIKDFENDTSHFRNPKDSVDYADQFDVFLHDKFNKKYDNIDDTIRVEDPISIYSQRT